MIRAVLFDVGGTFTTVYNSPELRTAFAKRLSDRLSLYGIELNAPYEELGVRLHENAEAYKHHVEETRVELPNARVWSEFYLRDYAIPEETIAPYAEELSFLYDYERMISLRRPHLKETLETLRADGYLLGVVSNVFSRSLTPHLLMEYGIDGLMDTVILSSEVGVRKPDPRIFEIAMDRIGVTKDETCYVGDTLSRDVLGSRNAGLALSIQIENPAVAHRDVAFTGPDGPKPDFFIHDLAEIPPILARVNRKSE
ncbi:MAG: HAD family hydrolase [Firmicutes bacterium]|nr:HAD family hydrolase [Bacillota bacterium]